MRGLGLFATACVMASSLARAQAMIEPRGKGRVLSAVGVPGSHEAPARTCPDGGLWFAVEAHA